ncbi:MAG TPA: helix-turn-helix transcriptional regulator [Polyangia bacterium]|jgi:predicted transcriptional regulator|nr:helix-turn-helix transcriptional regulator [Polyangia bacterium]
MKTRTVRTHPWSKLEKKIAPDRLARIQAQVDEDIQAINLKNLREALGATQVEAAQKAAMAQSELSRLENAADVRLSTIRRYVNAMGGELEIFAVVKGKKIALHGV